MIPCPGLASMDYIYNAIKGFLVVSYILKTWLGLATLSYGWEDGGNGN